MCRPTDSKETEASAFLVFVAIAVTVAVTVAITAMKLRAVEYDGEVAERAVIVERLYLWQLTAVERAHAHYEEGYVSHAATDGGVGHHADRH